MLALGAFFVLALGVSACGSGVPGNSVAVMDGNPITTQAFDHWMYVAAKGNASQSPGAPVIVPTDPPAFTACIAQVRKQIPSLAKTPDKTIKSDCGQLFTSLSSQVMDFLIKAYWYQAEAHKLGINITPAQINKAFESAKKQQFPTAAQFTEFLSETGQTLQDIMFRVKINQIYEKLLARYTPKVTPATIAAYYQSHTSEFGSPQTRDIRIVRANSEKQVLAAKAALQSGQSWATVAKKYSIDSATKDNGGLLTGVTNGEEEHALNVAAFAAPVNKLEGPIHGTFGWYVFEVTAIKPATQQTLAKATTLIKQLLSSQGSTSAETKVNSLSKKAWGKQTLCRTAYSMDDCNGYKPPKAATTTPATSSTTPTAPTTTPTTTGTATVTTGAATSSTGTSTTP
jgi:foldase protein PrsA